MDEEINKEITKYLQQKERRETEMVTAQFNAFCPFEIGDKVQDITGRFRTITDIACIHYVRTGKVEFRFELDHSGRYVRIRQGLTGNKE